MYVDELFLMRKWIDSKLCEHEQSVDNVMVQKLTILDSITKRSIQKMHATMDERDIYMNVNHFFRNVKKSSPPYSSTFKGIGVVIFMYIFANRKSLAQARHMQPFHPHANSGHDNCVICHFM